MILIDRQTDGQTSTIQVLWRFRLLLHYVCSDEKMDRQTDIQTAKKELKQ